MNRNFYQNARKRCMPLGTNIVTDADIILMQEEEIELYRGKIKLMEKALEELEESEEKFSQMLDSKNDTIRELKKALDESSKVIRPGDIVKVEGNYALITFKAENCIAHLSAKEEQNVEMCGTLIAMESVLSE